MSVNLKERDTAFDAFRGVAIIAVVATHAIPWQLYQVQTVLSYRQLLNFAVPAFLFISGYWMSKKPVNTLDDYTIFLRQRLTRVLIPYFFWSLIFIGYEMFKSNHIGVTQLLYKLFIGGASFHFYFIIVLVQLYMLTPLLQRLNRKTDGFVLVLILNAAAICVLYYFHLRGNDTIRDSYYMSNDPFLLWVVFYQFGLFVGSRDSEISVPKSVHRAVLLAIFASLSVSVWEALFILSKFDDWQMAICALKYSSVVYSTCIILGFLVLRRCLNTWPRFLVILGNYSFGIYLVHMIVLRGLVHLLQNARLLHSFEPFYEFIVMSMTLLICCVIIAVSRKLLPKPIYNRVLGF